jgi:hypothetical protein
MGLPGWLFGSSSLVYKDQMEKKMGVLRSNMPF